MIEEKGSDDKGAYPAIIGALKSPLSVFGLAMLICNAVFSISAAFIDDINAFIYSIHTFLAIVFAFIIIAIWSPASLYHPAELVGLEQSEPEARNAKLIITLVILLCGFVYAGYQVNKLNIENRGTASCEDAAEGKEMAASVNPPGQ